MLWLDLFDIDFGLFLGVLQVNTDVFLGLKSNIVLVVIDVVEGEGGHFGEAFSDKIPERFNGEFFLAVENTSLLIDYYFEEHNNYRPSELDYKF